MRAQLGDWIVVESTTIDGPRREGQVVGLRHPDGTPPFEVHWLSDDRTTLYFPGPDARLRPHGPRNAAT